MDPSGWFATWVLIFTVPKLLIIPLVKWMWDAMRASERQDVEDALWLAELEAAGSDATGDGDGGALVRPSRHPRPFGPWRPRPEQGNRPARRPTSPPHRARILRRVGR